MRARRLILTHFAPPIALINRAMVLAGFVRSEIREERENSFDRPGTSVRNRPANRRVSIRMQPWWPRDAVSCLSHRSHGFAQHGFARSTLADLAGAPAQTRDSGDKRACARFKNRRAQRGTQPGLPEEVGYSASR